MKPKFTISNDITKGLTIIERTRGFLDAAVLSEDWIAHMSSQALLKEAHHTTHIEGTDLSLDQAGQILAGENVPNADSDDKQEVLNYKKAFDFVSEYLESGDPITECLIRSIHRKLVENVRGGSADPGEYRKIQNYVANSATGEVIYTPPTAYDVPILMAELVNWINVEKEIHPVLISGILQFQFVHIHPFLDGNGRTSRLLSTLQLYKSGYDFKRLFTISEFYDRDRAAFYKAIQQVRENNMDMTCWLEFFIEGLVIQMREVQKRGEFVIRRDVLGKKFDLSERQNKILFFFMENIEGNTSELQEFIPDVNIRSIQRDIKVLLKTGLIKQKGETYNRRYSFNNKAL